ncbi:hypothetical protein FNJ87_18270 [Nonlabens mediterrranea]|uniref:Lipoprotein n=2 Tax=Nonlabens mediterrranea TaxID=1419947 RepID=A0ABS0A9U8_9FLAO|nr:hypothetical protein [Nonlabens mediterrranea]
MKYLIYSCIVIFLFSCEARIDNNKRALFSTTVVDANGTPLENVEVVVYSGFYYYNLQSYSFAKFSDIDEDFILGSGITDSNGDVSFLMLVNTDEQTSFSLTSDDYPRRNVSISDGNYASTLEYTLPTQTLKQSSLVSLNFSNTSGTTDVYNAITTFESINCSQFTDEGIITGVSCEDQEFFLINQSTSDTIVEIETVYPSIMTVEYEDATGTLITEQFMITNATESYVIQF